MNKEREREKKKIGIHPKGENVYLNEGTGYPCAGQESTTLEPALFSIHPPFKLPVNVGALLPTGSNESHKEAEQEHAVSRELFD